ncbi:unnamed protein product [Camellia sinensis]
MFIKYDGTGNSCSIFHSHWMGCKSKHAVAYCIVINVLDMGGVPRSLPTPIHLLKSLTLYNIGLYGSDQISCTLCLIRSYPNWTTLQITLSSKACTAKSIFEELVPNHLEAPDCINQMLDILRSVKISQIKGWKLELLFIKLLLAHSTMLETMFVEHCVTVDVQEGFEISKELARFPQGSPKAAIMY